MCITYHEMTKENPHSHTDTISSQGFSMQAVGSAQDKWDQVWMKKARDMTFYDLVNEGLVNPDEWSLLARSERDGLPSYQSVYYWVQVLHLSGHHLSVSHVLV